MADVIILMNQLMFYITLLVELNQILNMGNGRDHGSTTGDILHLG